LYEQKKQIIKTFLQDKIEAQVVETPMLLYKEFAPGRGSGSGSDAQNLFDETLYNKVVELGVSVLKSDPFTGAVPAGYSTPSELLEEFVGMQIKVGEKTYPIDKAEIEGTRMVISYPDRQNGGSGKRVSLGGWGRGKRR